MISISFNELLDKIQASESVSKFYNSVKTWSQPIELEGSEGSLTGILTAKAALAAKTPLFVIVPRETDADEIAHDLAELNIPVMKFPGWGTVPYREISLLSAIFAERAKILGELTINKPAIIIIPQRALLSPVPQPDYIKDLLITLTVSSGIDTDAFVKTLISYGYIRVLRVQVQGEFALRGEVLDIFIGGGTVETGMVFRILLDFDTIESIKKFDPAIQITIDEKINSLTIYPMKEIIWTDERIECLQKNLSVLKEIPDGGRALIEELTEKRSVQGEEIFYPLAFKEKTSLLDYLDSRGTLVLVDRERLENAQDAIEKEYHNLYLRSSRENTKFGYPMPERILLKYSDLINKYKNTQNPRLVSFRSIKGKLESDYINIELPCEPARSFFGNIDYLNDEFSVLIKSGWQIVIAAESQVQAERIKKMFEPLENALSPAAESLAILSTPLVSGFSLPDIKLILIQENEIFGRRKHAPRSLKTALSRPIDTFVELNPGDYIVHVNHGIGLFKGIERLKSLGHERDYINIEYADEESVFVPVEQVNLVQRYIGSDGQPPRLDTIGSKSWESRKSKAKQAAEEIAEKLIGIYSKRKQAQGFAFGKDSEWQTMFEAAFPFEETPDQIRCIEEIKKDMESQSPMDRLVCGDVGYGKTEVAVRACFKAVMCGKQAAFLAPTTILAEQHYNNFLERFSRFPVNIAMLSRFVDRKKTRIILQKVKNGEVDLLIGTHRIIQKDVQFKNLGLLVIDEEQRFGVKDKERLKELKANVDCLTLSATPIPRTLHMSLVKIRDMSILATAPPGRRPIETFVEEYDTNRIAAAIRTEVERGGQVFFLHNRIETLRDTRVKLEKLLPEMLVEVAHGQMESRDLEDTMRRFIHGGFHVLVSTTIIENGIDIPNVNTIIIDRADMYGVSQLYQLRGRVGRSDRTAYAYLFYPRQRALTELAMKRLQTISDFTELGSGFKIAMKDMEIRGAGNLLGREQSGYIYSVGFDLYLKLLEQAVKKLEDSEYEAEIETLLELEYSGFIPNEYIDSPQEKMEIYKMIAAVTDKEELDRVYDEIIDRFGPLPDEAASLLALAEIRIICRNLSVSSLRERSGIARIEFAKVSRIKVDRLVRMIQESSGKVKLDAKKPNVILLATGSIGLKEKSEFIREKLSVLAG
ncbi:MAG: transcription-repair coupling factor [Treponema sp.]|jgi:transcription-repair coupling factor (superfamily II helicase)|nr:transcription-repair coupling factor [Treponema sp.]